MPLSSHPTSLLQCDSLEQSMALRSLPNKAQDQTLFVEQRPSSHLERLRCPARPRGSSSCVTTSSLCKDRERVPGRPSTPRQSMRERACDDEHGPSIEFEEETFHNEKPVPAPVPVDYPLKMDRKTREDYTYARNLHSLTTMFSRPKIGRTDHNVAAGTQGQLPLLAHLPSPVPPNTPPPRTLPVPPLTHPAPSHSSSQSLQNAAERSQAFAQARGENIARTNEVAFQLGATILQSFELVQTLIELQNNQKSLDEGISENTTVLEEHFRNYPEAERLSSMLDAFLHHQTLGAIVNPRAPSQTQSNQATVPLSSRLSVCQVRRLGFAYSTNPAAVAKHVQEMWPYT
ncbi:hypothetical protein CC1G_06103 [Coprinopsis cinerea okayama7|uniref:Uncharacterized protein n=1 Tax=Coprinopsis cinerea (strain Okayama-7 / 130 / ATCC MYA-4618 / FGSC 9003) TaxID=240176 RepID=A8PA64_COPC7|nr:hypothetical protein CC1G_06103 [Coprinopsis cinerea okayama7\|eukprot:XP_001839913.2 hypothetical protein CC1G_06103 [Coprinopsis cinerea okayama7\